MTLTMCWRAAYVLASRSLPNVFAMMSYVICDLVNLVSISHAPGSTIAQIDGIGIGNLMQNVVAVSFALGVLDALETLVPQAAGRGEMEATAEILMRGRVLTLLCLLWMGPLLYFTEDLMTFIGQDPAAAAAAGKYNRAALWGLAFLFQNEAARKYLVCLGRADVGFYIGLATSAAHCAWVYLLVYRLGLGNFGMGVANCILWASMAVLTNAYLFICAPQLGVRRAWLLEITAGFRGWSAYLRVAVPAIVVHCAEWWFWECITFVVSYLGVVQLAAHVCMVTVETTAFMVAQGISSTAATLVGAALGRGDAALARLQVRIACVWTVLVADAVGVALVVNDAAIVDALTDAPAVKESLAVLIRVYAVAGVFDALQNVLAGALRGCGRSGLSSRAYFACFYGLMLPGAVAAAVWQPSATAVWVAIGVGLLVSATVFACLCFTQDFEQLAVEAMRSSSNDKAASLVC